MKILITSGGTTEKIDAVRGITNFSSGRLGQLIAEKALSKGHQVTLVTTPSAVKPSENNQLNTICINSVEELNSTIQKLVPKQDAVIHTMAVSDYTPVYMTDFDQVKHHDDLTSFLEKENTAQKIASQADYQVLFLKKTPKIISSIKKWNPSIRLIGFKLLVGVSKNELIKRAQNSLKENHADYIVANDLTEIKADKHHAYIVSDNDIVEATDKMDIAQKLIERLETK